MRILMTTLDCEKVSLMTDINGTVAVLCLAGRAAGTLLTSGGGLGGRGSGGGYHGFRR